MSAVCMLHLCCMCVVYLASEKVFTRYDYCACVSHMCAAFVRRVCCGCAACVMSVQHAYYAFILQKSDMNAAHMCWDSDT